MARLTRNGFLIAIVGAYPLKETGFKSSAEKSGLRNDLLHPERPFHQDARRTWKMRPCCEIAALAFPLVVSAVLVMPRTIGKSALARRRQSPQKISAMDRGQEQGPLASPCPVVSGLSICFAKIRIGSTIFAFLFLTGRDERHRSGRFPYGSTAGHQA